MLKWRILDTDYMDGFANMAVDEAILQQNIEGKSPPTIRFYRWNPPTVTLGYFQDYEKEMLPQVCSDMGIQIVRRLTGGRAILHQHELTYSVVANEKEQQVSGSIIESYLKISKALVKGLKYYGVEVEMAARPSKEKTSAACFDAPSWYEIVWQGRKLVGSAQTRRQGYLLQHGSIPFRFELDLLFELLNIASFEVKERLKRNFIKKAVGLEEITGQTANYGKLSAALAQGFADVFGVELIWGELTPDEVDLAEHLRNTKYCQDSWNHQRNKG
ncbi:MAG: biotin/lipoate A/B protein ligase family protein [Bacillota bacterium]